MLSIASTAILSMLHVLSPPQPIHIPAIIPPRSRGCILQTPDPFRPARPPIEPMVINAVQELLGGTRSAADVAASALEARRADPDYTLTPEEEALLTRWVVQCGDAGDSLVALLNAAVEATPWIGQFKMTASFGVGEASDPYVRASRAECMLAALILHVDGGEVSFIEEDRLEVLRDAAPADAVDRVRVACAASYREA